LERPAHRYALYDRVHTHVGGVPVISAPQHYQRHWPSIPFTDIGYSISTGSCLQSQNF
jgi:hypothetical protein